MRRPRPTALPAFLHQPGTAPSLGDKPACLEWAAGFHLSTITPIIGGGVESAEPDAIDLVRVPGIRGQLRHWWRFLYAEDDEMERPGAAEGLFARESALWGGLDVAAGDGGKNGSRVSRVRLRVRVDDAGEVLPAGWHEISHRGKLKTLPRWALGNRLAYALFPLQRTAEERARHRGPQKMATRPVRQGLRFRLELKVRGEKPAAEPVAEDVRQVLAAVWAWVHLGGLGARTRRGFGALALEEPPELGDLDGLKTEWSSLFRPPGGELGKWWTAFRRAAWPGSEAPPLRFSTTEALAGEPAPHGDRAHEELVGLLATFRQGPRVGRDPSRDRRPGESRWPEPDLLRLARASGARERKDYDHPPSREAIEAYAGEELGAPRAAFGLPLQVRFKYTDRRDGKADATLLPEGSQRWSSPLLLRPLRTAGGNFTPVIWILGGSRPDEVRIEFAGATGKATVKGSAGARDVIAEYLGKAEGDALRAFALWLRDNHRYRPLTGGAGGRKRHG